MWVEYFRGHASPQVDAVREGLKADTLASCDAVAVELACWPGSEAAAATAQAVLGRCHYLHQLPHEDVRVAGAIYRACRRAGETVRRANDCLIAAIAIRHDLPLLHRDRDFDAIARHTRLRIVE